MISGGATLTANCIRNAEQILSGMAMQAKVGEHLKNGDDDHGIDPSIIARCVAYGEITQAWRAVGRQTLAIHPDLQREVVMATSDKLYPETLRALPYINPMVVFPDPPPVRSWKTDGGEELRMLGFLAYGSADGRRCDTNDPDISVLGVAIMYEVWRDGIAVDIENATINLDLDGEPETLAKITERVANRYRWEASQDTDWERSRHFVSDSVRVALSCLCYLASTVIDAEAVPRKTVARRQNRQVERKPMSIYQVGWTVGPALSRYRAQAAGKADAAGGGGRGGQRDPEHRKAHFKMQPYGPGRALRRLTFIAPYWTHREKLGLVGTNTARRVK